MVLGLMVEQGYITQARGRRRLGRAAGLQAGRSTTSSRRTSRSLCASSSSRCLARRALYHAGLNVTTTLDPKLQAEAERIVAQQVAALADRNVSNGALVSMRPQTGEVVALVGSADFDNVEIDGQVNMAFAPRQPGSSTKPFVYLSNFESPGRNRNEAWTPTAHWWPIFSVPFPDGANPPYVPTNYDGQEHGMVTVRTALANSYNIPAVAALQNATLPQYLELMRRLGVTTLNRPDFGLSLSLGAGEIPLIELTDAYAAWPTAACVCRPVTIQKITDSAGNVICEQNTDRPCQDATGQQVISPVDAFLITDILSDNEARLPAFGSNSPLVLADRPVAAKTGTTNDYRDNLTMGYTPQFVTGVWVGNTNNTPMQNVTGVTGAGPIWNEFMTIAHQGLPVAPFTPPAGVRQFEVCADTGTAPSDACPERRTRWFAEDRPPLPKEKDLWQKLRVVRGTNELATEFTPADQVEERVFKVYPPEYRAWAEAHGMPQPPANAPVVTDPSLLQVAIVDPPDGMLVAGVVPVFGSANVPDFASYELQYGESHDPGAFSAPIYGPVGGAVVNGQLGQWDTTSLQNGPHTLRLLVRDNKGAQYEARVRVFVENNAAVSTLEPTATWTPEVIPPTETPTLPPVPVPDTPVPPPPPTPVPEQPTAIPDQPTAIPEQPTAVPEQPTAVPEQPTVAPPEVQPLPTEVPTDPAAAAAVQTETLTTTVPLTVSEP